ncbi:hypothetical protein [Campylobacter mucosalis]|nr:hypothetical protein [Campylobacter mucosalis]
MFLIPATPFAIAPFIQDNMTSIGIYKDLKREQKNIFNNAKTIK